MIDGPSGRPAGCRWLGLAPRDEDVLLLSALSRSLVKVQRLSMLNVAPSHGSSGSINKQADEEGEQSREISSG